MAATTTLASAWAQQTPVVIDRLMNAAFIGIQSVASLIFGVAWFVWTEQHMDVACFWQWVVVVLNVFYCICLSLPTRVPRLSIAALSVFAFVLSAVLLLSTKDHERKELGNLFFLALFMTVMSVGRFLVWAVSMISEWHEAREQRAVRLDLANRYSLLPRHVDSILLAFDGMFPHGLFKNEYERSFNTEHQSWSAWSQHVSALVRDIELGHSK